MRNYPRPRKGVPPHSRALLRSRALHPPLSLTTARWSRPGCPLGRSMVAPAALFPGVQPNSLPPARVVQSAQRVAGPSARLRSLRSPLARPCGSSRRRHRRRISRSLHTLARYGARCQATPFLVTRIASRKNLTLGKVSPQQRSALPQQPCWVVPRLHHSAILADELPA